MCRYNEMIFLVLKQKQGLYTKKLRATEETCNRIVYFTFFY